MSKRAHLLYFSGGWWDDGVYDPGQERGLRGLSELRGFGPDPAR